MRQVLKPGSRTSKHEPQEADLGLVQRTRIWGIGVAGTLVTLRGRFCLGGRQYAKDFL